MSWIHRVRKRIWWSPEPVEPVDVEGTAPVWDGGSLRVLSWNVQFCAGRERFFFYDGGPDSRVTEAECRDALQGIARVIRSTDPDLVLLQEVDRNSQRTHGIDQHAQLARALELPCTASTPYFRVPFVPVPPLDPMGRVEMHLSVFSRHRLTAGRRVALSALDEPRWRRMFNLRRAVLDLGMPVANQPDLQILLTHLSAFSKGDGTLERQVGTLAGLARGERVLMAGDLNCLPPGDDPARLGDAATLYAERQTPIAPLFEQFDVLSDVDQRTYVPFGTNRADRTIDYVFGRGLEVRSATVLTDGALWSDHLPLVLDLQLAR